MEILLIVDTRPMPFKVGEKVVYPNHGVGMIDQIAHSNLNGQSEKYYLVRVFTNGLKVTVPCLNAHTVGLRRTIKPAEIPQVLRHLENGKVDAPRDWKLRFKQNSEKMRTGSLYDVAEVIKCLLRMGKTKPLSFREKKMRDRARHLLVSELAIVRNVTEETVVDLVQKALGKSNLSLPEPT